MYRHGDLTAAAREQMRWLLERTMETEVTQRLGAERYGRSATRTDWRNGYRSRDLVTELGLLKGLREPRSPRPSFPRALGSRGTSRARPQSPRWPITRRPPLARGGGRKPSRRPARCRRHRLSIPATGCGRARLLHRTASRLPGTRLLGSQPGHSSIRRR